MLFTLCDRANGLWPRGGHVRPQADYRNATLFWDTLSMSAWREDSSFTSLHYWPLMLTNINPALKSYGTLLYWEILCVVSKYFKLFERHFRWSCVIIHVRENYHLTLWLTLCDKGSVYVFFLFQDKQFNFFCHPNIRNESDTLVTPAFYALVALPWILI